MSSLKHLYAVFEEPQRLQDEIQQNANKTIQAHLFGDDFRRYFHHMLTHY